MAEEGAWFIAQHALSFCCWFVILIRQLSLLPRKLILANIKDGSGCAFQGLLKDPPFPSSHTLTQLLEPSFAACQPCNTQTPHSVQHHCRETSGK